MEIINDLCIRYPALACCRQQIVQACEAVTDTYKTGGKALACGNGGSAADADHIVGELMKGFMKRRPLERTEHERFGDMAGRLQGALPAISLGVHGALMTAYANDVDPSMVFAQQVYGYGKAGDVLIGISTSGNSENVVNAMQIAKALGLKTIALTGESGGKLKALSDICICVPAKETFAVQEYHLPVYHAICAAVETYFFSV